MPWTCAACGRASSDDASFCGTCGISRPVAGEVTDADVRLGETVLGRYKIVAKIGEGGMGAVYRAEQKMGTTTRRVAVKILLSIHVRDPALRNRFVRECEVVVHLEHPNTIKFFDFGELPDGSMAIVMEYVDGVSLADEITRGPLTVERALKIVGQICGSLHEAHARGIIHRDLKPENVLLGNVAGERDVVKVLDFGIAKTPTTGHGPVTLDGTVLGTPQYMSPEQLAGRALDKRSDVYSLAILTYEMLTGTLPFAPANTPFEWAERHLNATPISIDTHSVAPALSAAGRTALMQALEKDPERRPASVLELARALIGNEKLELAWGLATLLGAPAPSRGSITAPMVGGLPLTPLPQPAAATAPIAPITRTNMKAVRPRRLGRTIAIVLVVAMFVGAALAVPGYFAYQYYYDGSGSDPTVDPAAPPVEEPDQWLGVVYAEHLVQSPLAATGAPDENLAEIRRGGSLVLELPSGTVLATDSGPAPDLNVLVDAARSGPYRVEAASDDEYTPIVAAMTGQLLVDIDPLALRSVRFIRISSAGDRAVYLDAVGVYGLSHTN